MTAPDDDAIREAALKLLRDALADAQTRYEGAASAYEELKKERDELAFKLGQEVARGRDAGKFVDHALAVIPYVRATVSPGNRFPGSREHWCEVHEGRADSSVVQLDNLEREAMAIRARGGK